MQHYGQSFDGLMNEPPVARAATQNALGAPGSPSIGIRMTLKGTPRGYLPLALLWFVGGVLTGLRLPYFGVVLASGLLFAAWAGDRRKYPVDISAAGTR